MSWKVLGRPSRLIAPQKRDIVGIQIPGERKENGHGAQRTEEKADRKSRREPGNGHAAGARGHGEEDSAGEREAAGYTDTKQARGEALLPADSGKKKRAVNPFKQSQQGEEEGKHFADVEDQRGIVGDRLAASNEVTASGHGACLRNILLRVASP